MSKTKLWFTTAEIESEKDILYVKHRELERREWDALLKKFKATRWLSSVAAGELANQLICIVFNGSCKRVEASFGCQCVNCAAFRVLKGAGK